ncbi:hypothetical protein MARVELLAND_69 [Bacillus phage vB_BspM_MarvelLand]|nr:hypothetical protein MARVELLAND_69 [Bacillus phage vB_BspM_MarvelLand]
MSGFYYPELLTRLSRALGNTLARGGVLKSRVRASRCFKIDSRFLYPAYRLQVIVYTILNSLTILKIQIIIRIVVRALLSEYSDNLIIQFLRYSSDRTRSRIRTFKKLNILNILTVRTLE